MRVFHNFCIFAASMINKMKKILIIIISGLIIITGILYSLNIFGLGDKEKSEMVDSSKIQKKENILYGINADKFYVEQSIIEPDMYLSTLFERYKVIGKLQGILEKAKDIFDVRKIKRDQKYSVFFKKDTSRTVEYIVYEKDKTNYIVFDLRDPLNVYEGRKKVDVFIKEAGGVINSNLWFDMEEAGLEPVMAIPLSDIFAWSVDFYGLQINDRFKLIYEEKFVNDSSIGYGKILAAYFEHYGDTIYAIPFNQDTVVSFYDQKGNSLKKAFLKAPLNFTRIASQFSHARMHPILKIVRPHLAVDYSAPSGTPVVALGDGTVIFAAYSGGAGNFVKIKHNSMYTTGYMHLKGYGPDIRIGARVRQGQLIGYVGSTGLSTGPHLDFRVWKNGENIDPLKMESPPVEPIKDFNKANFDKAKKVYMDWLDKITYTEVKMDTLSADNHPLNNN
jgi:murein DD-endopeptidase MepM/ murein hydrolase activator NlpD